MSHSALDYYSKGKEPTYVGLEPRSREGKTRSHEWKAWSQLLSKNQLAIANTHIWLWKQSHVLFFEFIYL